jgi:DNA polymerase-3 subunit epsilon
MDIFANPMTFVDIETTGLSPVRDRVIEVAAIRVEKGKIVETYEQLINPEMILPNDITLLTGITNQTIEKAPRFFDIIDDLSRLMKDSLFVAHNARFDYGFIKHEYKRYEEHFFPKQLCTVKLFRVLVPGLSHYNLDSLISYFAIDIPHRHRALSDATALWEFIKKSQIQFSPSVIQHAVDTAMKRQILPTHIATYDIDKLPQTPGVYLLYGEDPTPLYIGKSIIIRDRVLSHFSDSIHSVKESKIAHQVRRIETIETPGELSALLLEATLVKQYQPLYNRQLRRKQKVLIAREIFKDKNYMSLDVSYVDFIDPDEVEHIISIFSSQRQTKEQLMQVAQEHKLCPKLLSLEMGKGACFWYQLGWCKGACIGKESVASYNLRFKIAFASYTFKRWPFEGPVVISEQSDSKYGGIVVDKWCVLGTLSEHEQFRDVTTQHYTFDKDTYRILARYIFSLKHQVSIKPYTHL